MLSLTYRAICQQSPAVAQTLAAQNLAQIRFKSERLLYFYYWNINPAISQRWANILCYLEILINLRNTWSDVDKCERRKADGVATFKVKSGLV